MNATSKKHEFIGEYGWQLRWSESDSGFKLENSKIKNVIGNNTPKCLSSIQHIIHIDIRQKSS